MYESGIINGKPIFLRGHKIMSEKDKRIMKACEGIVQRFLAHQKDEGVNEEQHRALYKPMNQGIRRNGRQP